MLFKKKSATKKNYKVEFIIETINTEIPGTREKTVVPNFISTEGILRGTYKGGWEFSFEKIINFEIVKGGTKF